MFKRFTPLIFLTAFFAGQLAAQCNVTNYGSSQVISSNTTLPAGTYNVTGDFTVNAGVILTITYSGNCPFTLNATNINILGEINANGTGAAGGAGGAGGNSSGGGGGGREAAGGSGGSAGSGIGGGTGGQNGSVASGGCGINCGNFVCAGGNDADRAGGGGGAGGAGGSFGAAGGNGGAGALGRFENEPGNSDCGSTPVPGGGGAGNAGPNGYSNTATNADLPTGSGGGGGGGGGGGFTTGTTGGNGGSGGGTVNLNATNNLVVSGTITANGTAGAAGGDGGVRSGNAANWNCESCANGDGGGANDCRDNSQCGACTYYTWSWPGGAGAGAGGGSGGGIKLQSAGVMTVTGTLQANGGNGGSAGHGNTTDGSCNNYAAGGAAGGGGVIKYVYNPCAPNIFIPTQAQVIAGTPGNGTDGNPGTNTGSAGVVFDQSANIYVAGFTPFTTLTAYPSQVLCGVGLTPSNINTFAISGGDGTYTYQWYYSTTTNFGQTGATPTPVPGWVAFNGGTSSSLPGASIGALNRTTYYQLLVSSGPCNTWSNVVTVLVDSIPSITNVTVSNVLCNGGNTGSITVTATGGNPGYTYSSDAGSLYTAGNVLANLSQGSYTVYVKDTNNCSAAYASNPVVVNQPTALNFTDTVVKPNCTGLSNGSITITASGGVSPYNYAINAGNAQLSDLFPGLAAGNYLVLVTDANACPDTATVVLSNRYVISLAIDTQTNTSCFGAADGSIVFTASGGIVPDSFAITGTGFQASSTFTGLAGGYYVGTVHDSAGCANQINFEINQATQMQVQIEAIVDIPCNNSSPGQVFVSPLGGTPNYKYAWSTGDTAQNQTNLSLGNYTVTITDRSQCTATATVPVTYDPSPTAVVSSTDVTGCFGNTNGSASVTASGGTTPYIYQWSNDATTASISNITGGVYIVTISDLNYCTSIDTVVVSSPPQLLANLDTIAPLCAGLNNGQAGVAPSGGTPVYTVAWSTSSNADTIVNLAPGSYRVTVTDANNCSSVSSFTLAQPAPISVVLSSTNDSCNGSPDGSITLNATGGVSPFSYVWSNGGTTANISNLTAGTYTVNLNDANQCSFTDSVAITQPAALVITTAFTNASGGQDNGTASVNSITGGVSPYSVRWSNGEVTDSISGLAGGSYTVNVTDQNGCVQTSTVVINQLTGVNMLQGDIAFSIYPNPANTAFTVELSQLNKETTLTIKNVLGENVLAKTITALKTNVNLSSFASGVYMVELIQGNSRTTREVVVSK